MALEEFSYVVLGDEPAGLWLAEKLVALGQRLPPRPRIAWIRLAPHALLPDVCLPSAAAERLKLRPSPGFSPEILTPRTHLLWAKNELVARFPDLPGVLFGPDRLKESVKPSPATVSALDRTIRRHPELVGYAEGLWKFFGRTLPRSSPLTGSMGAPKRQKAPLLAATLLCSDVTWWRPWEHVPLQVERFFLPSPEGALEEVTFGKGGGLVLKFRDLPALHSPTWILNTSYANLLRLAEHKPDFLPLALETELRLEPEAIYPLDLTVEASAVPSPVSPLSVWLDSDSIPDPSTEAWPFSVASDNGAKHLRLWVNAPGDISLEATADKMREGLRRLNRLFPFLSRRILSLRPSLDLSTCASADSRTAAMEGLTVVRQELYRLSTLRTETRHPALQAFFPSLHCHLPTPLGPLLAAERWLAEMTQRAEKAAERRAKDPRPPAPPSTGAEA